MMQPSDFALSSLEAAIRAAGLGIGLPLSWVAETESTNTDAASAANEGAAHGALFLADHQTRGRGRMGRTWLSPAGANLYASLVLRPSLPVERLPAITLAVGLGVADGVARCVQADRVGLKWPNDVLIGGKKVAGILVEGAVSGDRCEHVVVGFGINVLQRDFDVSIASTATSLAIEAGAPLLRDRVLLAVLEGVASRIGAFERGGLSSMMEDLRARDAVRGRRVRVGELRGVADGIESDGRLRVRLEDGIGLVHAGEVEIVG